MNMTTTAPAQAPAATQAPAKPRQAKTAQAKAAPAARATPAPASTAPAGFRPAAFPPTARVTIVAEGNPKRPGSKAAGAWAAYTDARGKKLGTVAEVMARFAELKFPKRYARSALRWDSQHGFIKIEA